MIEFISVSKKLSFSKFTNFIGSSQNTIRYGKNGRSKRPILDDLRNWMAVFSEQGGRVQYDLKSVSVG